VWFNDGFYYIRIRLLTGSGKMKQDDNRAKPLKRPSQERSKFTVRAIYGAFVRIWQQQGWEHLTTRAVALEAGVSIGTLYEYFPNKRALLSGYVRDCIEVLLEEIERQVIQPTDLDWRERVRRLVRLNCGVDAPELPYFDAAMLGLESQIAEPKHHRRAYEELSEKWARALEACTDLPHPPTADRVRALFMSVRGGIRYFLLVNPGDISANAWGEQMTQLCYAVLLSNNHN
jgi:AcrR family transcriptional regulator